MPEFLSSRESGFSAKLLAALETTTETNEAVNATVISILADVKKRGDAALVEYTNRFDRVTITAKDLRIPQAEIDKAYATCGTAEKQALELAAERIAVYHKRQMPEDFQFEDKAGVTLGNWWKPLEKAGLYVPGGLASYPSSVLMNAIPAKVAGVMKLVMVVPAPDGVLNPLVLAAAKIAGVDEIYRIGGAQAIAALAYGTATIARVDKIVGPGNAYVAAAKRHVFGEVGIDMIAGPSEILVVADQKNNPDWIAADLLSQAEHDKEARSILITDNRDYADKVVKAVEETLKTLPRQDIARVSWDKNGVVILVDNMREAPAIIDAIAPEHLELAIDNPEAMAKDIRNAGAIFLGRLTPEAVGDYTAGPSHVLPTSGTAKFSSGLSVFDFLKRISVVGCSEKGFAALHDATALLATSEGLDAHALSVTRRGKKN